MMRTAVSRCLQAVTDAPGARAPQLAFAFIGSSPLAAPPRALVPRPSHGRPHARSRRGGGGAARCASKTPRRSAWVREATCVCVHSDWLCRPGKKKTGLLVLVVGVKTLSLGLAKPFRGDPVLYSYRPPLLMCIIGWKWVANSDPR